MFDSIGWRIEHLKQKHRDMLNSSDSSLDSDFPQLDDFWIWKLVTSINLLIRLLGL